MPSSENHGLSGCLLRQFERLHRELFPAAYFTAKQIIERQNVHHRVSIKTESGYVDFIGVDPSARSPDRIFAQLSARKIGLTVDADNKVAQMLHATFCFKAGCVMCGFRRQVS